jgi:hypothetical protein
MQITAETRRRRGSLTFLFAISRASKLLEKSGAVRVPEIPEEKKGIAGCFPAIPMLSTASSDIL